MLGVPDRGVGYADGKADAGQAEAETAEGEGGEAVGPRQEEHRNGAEEEQCRENRLPAELVGEHARGQAEKGACQHWYAQEPADLHGSPVEDLVVDEEGHHHPVEHPDPETDREGQGVQEEGLMGFGCGFFKHLGFLSGWLLS
jgi:hypothetical protein